MIDGITVIIQLDAVAVAVRCAVLEVHEVVKLLVALELLTVYLVGKLMEHRKNIVKADRQTAHYLQKCTQKRGFRQLFMHILCAFCGNVEAETLGIAGDFDCAERAGGVRGKGSERMLGAVRVLLRCAEQTRYGFRGIIQRDRVVVVADFDLCLLNDIGQALFQSFIIHRVHREHLDSF